MVDVEVDVDVDVEADAEVDAITAAHIPCLFSMRAACRTIAMA